MGWMKGRQQTDKARKSEKRTAPTPDPAPASEKPPGARVRFSRWTQEQRDAMTARARSARLARWRIMSGGPDHEINYDDPQIEVEWQLSDIENLRLVYKGRHRDEFLSKLSPGAREMYFKKDPDGKSYCETVEKPAFFRGFLRGIGIFLRGNDREIERLLKEIEEQNKADNEI